MMKEITTPRSALRRLFRLLKEEGREVSHMYVFAIFSGIVALSLPLGIQSVVNLVMSAQLSASWVLLVTLVIIGTLIAGLITLLQTAVLEKIQQNIFAKSAFELSYRFPRIESELSDRYYLPEIANRFFDTVTIQKGLSKILISLSTGTVQILFGLILLVIYHPIFIVFGVFLVGIIIAILAVTFRAGLESNYMESKYKYAMAHWLEELGRNQLTFKLAGNSALALSKTNDRVEDYLKYRKKHFYVLILQGGLLVLYKVLITGGLLILGSILILDNQINIGQFVAAEIIIILILASVEKLIESMEPLYDVLTAVEKIGYVTDLALDKSTEDVTPITNKDAAISLQIKHLSFKYDSRDKYSLRDINLQIGKGEKWCIYGANSSGKSVLLKVLAGIYDSYEGSISADGVSLRNIDKCTWQKSFGAHFNREYIFEGTLEENILLKRPWLSAEDLRNVMFFTGLEEDIAHWKDGYRTALMTEGKNISKSMVSKILLCRALVGRPPLLLLEDNLFDMAQEEADAIMHNLLSCNATIIMVSRRASMMRKFPSIAMIENGSLTFAGANNLYNS
jgi:ABC-type bacteriocin/lantibiotic exporter with double-glycine peptidase domain